MMAELTISINSKKRKKTIKDKKKSNRQQKGVRTWNGARESHF
jgi:hypothetical protein